MFDTSRHAEMAMVPFPRSSPASHEMVGDVQGRLAGSQQQVRDSGRPQPISRATRSSGTSSSTRRSTPGDTMASQARGAWGANDIDVGAGGPTTSTSSLVDTSAWTDFLRRRDARLRPLVEDNSAADVPAATTYRRWALRTDRRVVVVDRMIIAVTGRDDVPLLTCDRSRAELARVLGLRARLLRAD